MKTLLTTFFKSLTCKLMWAMVATAAAANAHDLPSDCPLAHDDWGMLQQDCMGVRDSHDLLTSAQALASLSISGHAIAEEMFAVAADAGEPPRPNRIVPSLDMSISEFRLDGIDCSILESQFRGYPLVEATAARAKALPILSSGINATSEFDRLYYGTCTCDFEQQVSDALRPATRFIFKRECVEDSVPLQFHEPRWRFMDHLGLTAKGHSPVNIAPLATAIPVASPHIATAQDKQLFSDLLSEFETWECMLQAEFCDCPSAFRVGQQLASLSSDWYQAALPKLVRSLNGMQMAAPTVAKVPAPGPMFVLYSLGGGKTLAIPVEQARQWKFAVETDVHAHGKVSEVSESVVSADNVSPEFSELLKQTSLRLKWAGGRLSQAADYLNDWFSIRLASKRSDDSMR